MHVSRDELAAPAAVDNLVDISNLKSLYYFSTHNNE